MSDLNKFDEDDISSCSLEGLKDLLFCLINIIASSDPEIATITCKKLVEMLQWSPQMFEIFDPNVELLARLRLSYLLEISSNNTAVFDLILFIKRYYDNIAHFDFDLGEELLEQLSSYELKKLWKTLDRVVMNLNDIKVKNKKKNVFV